MTPRLAVATALAALLWLSPRATLAQEPPPPAPQEPQHQHETDELEFEEELVVEATRTGRRVQDQALRVEVLGREEIEEKLLMTPGDVSMMLNETGGLRVQVSSPSLGAANVRVQGLKGRYTQILADGLPLYGGQTGSLGLLQIPPMDLGQVEVVKGVASALYGASALGGVINLVSRRPPEEQAQRELLFNRTTRQGTDGVLWLAGGLGAGWSASLLGGVHDQRPQDVDDDGWVDLAGYTRGLLRPRVFWQGQSGRSLFLTLGAMLEDREGGTLAGAVTPDGSAWVEALDTQRFDAGASARLPIGSRLLSLRASAMHQGHEHRFGPTLERDRHRTFLAEGSLTGTAGKHAWVLGAAWETDAYRAHDVAGFDYADDVPALFGQDDWTLRPGTTLSVSARLDRHERYGTFLSPRASLLLKPGRFTLRASLGRGFFGPTPFTEETEAVGLAQVQPLEGLSAERAWSGSLDAGFVAGALEVNATLFGSEIDDPVRVDPGSDGRLALSNVTEPTRTGGAELLARLRWRGFAATASYTFVDASEVEAGGTHRVELPLTPRHALGLVAAWERHGRARVAAELYYTGAQRLDDDPYLSESPAYVLFGLLVERRFGPARVFVNLENLGDVRQTREAPLVRPVQGPGGRWTVDAWGPLDGRTINAGVRLDF